MVQGIRGICEVDNGSLTWFGSILKQNLFPMLRLTCKLFNAPGNKWGMDVLIENYGSKALMVVSANWKISKREVLL